LFHNKDSVKCINLKELWTKMYNRDPFAEMRSRLRTLAFFSISLYEEIVHESYRPIDDFRPSRRLSADVDPGFGRWSWFWAMMLVLGDDAVSKWAYCRHFWDPYCLLLRGDVTVPHWYHSGTLGVTSVSTSSDHSVLLSDVIISAYLKISVCLASTCSKLWLFILRIIRNP
jgi:hypothetical protein